MLIIINKILSPFGTGISVIPFGNYYQPLTVVKVVNLIHCQQIPTLEVLPFVD
jgi:hypothetical protein